MSKLDPNPDADGFIHISFNDGDGGYKRYQFSSIIGHAIENGCLVIKLRTSRIHYPLTGISSFSVAYNSDEAVRKIAERRHAAAPSEGAARLLHALNANLVNLEDDHCDENE